MICNAPAVDSVTALPVHLEVLRILTIYRLLMPGSEWRLHRNWFATTALVDLVHVDSGAVADESTACNSISLP